MDGCQIGSDAFFVVVYLLGSELRIVGRRVCVYYCRTFYKAVRVGEEESGGHVL